MQFELQSVFPERIVAPPNPQCPCLIDLAPYGYSNLIANISGVGWDYHRTYGLQNCSQHDLNTEPFCDQGVQSPAWCEELWCYVNPNTCNASLEVMPSSYFSGLFYSTEACGAGKDDFASWFGVNASIGARCRTTVQCLGAQEVCNVVHTDSRCGCRATFALTGPGCDELTRESSWSIASISISIFAYLLVLAFQIRILVFLRNMYPVNLKPLGQPLVFGCLSSLMMLSELFNKLSALAGLSDKRSYDLIGNLFQSLGASAGILGYMTVSARWQVGPLECKTPATFTLGSGLNCSGLPRCADLADDTHGADIVGIIQRNRRHLHALRRRHRDCLLARRP